MMKHQPKLSVAAIQMTVKSHDIEANLATASRLLTTALKKEPLDLVVFPEDCITGPIPNHAELTLDETSEAITFYRQLATRHKLHLVCGSFIYRQGDKLFNRSLLIGPDGKTLLRYDKYNLWHPERAYLTAGSELPVVETPLGTIGIINCWDITNPTICRTLAQKGADIICCPSYWMDEVSDELYNKYPSTQPDDIMIDTLCQARAIENEVLLIYANVCGQAEIQLPDRTLHLEPIGHSQITAPIFGVLDRLPHGNDGVATARYDFAISRDAEKQYKFRQDMI